MAKPVPDGKGHMEHWGVQPAAAVAPRLPFCSRSLTLRPDRRRLGSSTTAAMKGIGDDEDSSDSGSDAMLLPATASSSRGSDSSSWTDRTAAAATARPSPPSPSSARTSLFSARHDGVAAVTPAGTVFTLPSPSSCESLSSLPFLFLKFGAAVCVSSLMSLLRAFRFGEGLRLGDE
ncbi:uncharacterized protein DS421_12g365100 [Arachis hypogaea]|nr:uncharacterized protein DS421_12g365100 [Arachis hypogaea]